MIRLDTTTRKLQAVLSGAVTTNQLPIIVAYSDKTSVAYAGASQLANTNNATAVDICASPAASTIRDVDYLSVYNLDTTAKTLTIRYNDNGTLYTILTVTLDIGDKLEYTHGSGWDVTSSTGSTKVSYPSNITAATLTVSGTSAFSGAASFGGTTLLTAASATLVDSKLVYNASAVSLANARNDNVVIPTTSTAMFVFSGGGVSCQLGGMVAPSDGTRVSIWNNTGQAISILFNDANSTAVNRIYTAGGATGTWNNLGVREFVYFNAIGRWLLIGGTSA